jgi:hypothetical protein
MSSEQSKTTAVDLTPLVAWMRALHVSFPRSGVSKAKVFVGQRSARSQRRRLPCFMQTFAAFDVAYIFFLLSKNIASSCEAWRPTGDNGQNKAINTAAVAAVLGPLLVS